MLILIKQKVSRLKFNTTPTGSNIGLWPAILTEEFCTFPQSLQVNVEIIFLNPWYSDRVPWNPVISRHLWGVLQTHFLYNKTGEYNSDNFWLQFFISLQIFMHNWYWIYFWYKWWIIKFYFYKCMYIFYFWNKSFLYFP